MYVLCSSFNTKDNYITAHYTESYIKEHYMQGYMNQHLAIITKYLSLQIKVYTFTELLLEG